MTYDDWNEKTASGHQAEGERLAMSRYEARAAQMADVHLDSAKTTPRLLHPTPAVSLDDPERFDADFGM